MTTVADMERPMAAIHFELWTRVFASKCQHIRVGGGGQSRVPYLIPAMFAFKVCQTETEPVCVSPVSTLSVAN